MLQSVPALNLATLRVALFHENRINSDLKVFCEVKSLEILYLHKNRLACELPRCISELMSLQVLTLHNNELVGEIPDVFGRMPTLQLFTLHKNALTGKLPMSFGDASTGQLSFFSAFGNDLIGPVPAFHLKEGCVDDMSFSIEVSDSNGIIALRCIFLYGEHEKGLRESLQDLNNYKLKPYQRQRVLEMCPNFFNRGNCSTASWRGPVLLLQSNRLSCALPASITSKAENLRSLTLMGNKLGNGKMELPPWVHDSEKQPFLYVSSRWWKTVTGWLLGSSLVFAMAFCCLDNGLAYIRNFRDYDDQSCQTCQMHWFLLKMNLKFAPIASVLLVFYWANATFYECGDQFGYYTLAYFSGKLDIFVAIAWFFWAMAGLRFLRVFGTTTGTSADRERRGSGESSKLRMFLWFVLWLCIIGFLSMPSVAYAMVTWGIYDDLWICCLCVFFFKLYFLYEAKIFHKLLCHVQ